MKDCKVFTGQELFKPYFCVITEYVEKVGGGWIDLPLNVVHQPRHAHTFQLDKCFQINKRI